MKKVAIILFSMFYLILASGFTQHIHFCKGTATTVHSLTDTGNQNQDKPCPMCSDKNNNLTDIKKNCCQHETKLVKLNNSVWQQLNFDFSAKILGDAIPNKLIEAVFDFPRIEPKQSLLYYSSKVLAQDILLYTLYCVYRI